jgi:hypothetical protein
MTRLERQRLAPEARTRAAGAAAVAQGGGRSHAFRRRPWRRRSYGPFATARELPSRSKLRRPLSARNDDLAAPEQTGVERVGTSGQIMAAVALLRAKPKPTDADIDAALSKMIFIGLSKADLCATVKDPQRNGGKDLAALLEHVSHDKLVLWGWAPGVGRAPVSIPHDAFVASVKTWIGGGAPCPEAGRPPRPSGSS